MPKYRRLSLEELEGLKDEFVKFLIVQGIDADMWSQMKVNDLEGSDAVIDLFSDFIWEGILAKVRYLETIDSNAIKLYHCDEDMIRLILIQSEDGHEHDFADLSSVTISMRNHPEHFRILRAQKEYKPSRGEEIFKLIDTEHSYVSKGEMYLQLSQAL